jgi:hypothetical protein
MERIISKPNVCGERPCIRDTRIEIAVIPGGIAEGMMEPEIMDHYPQLAKDEQRMLASCFFGISKIFYLSRPSRIISTISCVVISALIDGTSNGDVAFLSGTNAKVLPSFLFINTFPVSSACSSTKASFCLASE